MAVPKQRQNSSRSRRRRNHNIKKLKQVETVACSSCGEQKMSHRVCNKCGVYRGVQYKEIVQKAG